MYDTFEKITTTDSNLTGYSREICRSSSDQHFFFKCYPKDTVLEEITAKQPSVTNWLTHVFAILAGFPMVGSLSPKPQLPGVLLTHPFRSMILEVTDIFPAKAYYLKMCWCNVDLCLINNSPSESFHVKALFTSIFYKCHTILTTLFKRNGATFEDELRLSSLFS